MGTSSNLLLLATGSHGGVLVAILLDLVDDQLLPDVGVIILLLFADLSRLDKHGGPHDCV